MLSLVVLFHRDSSVLPAPWYAPMSCGTEKSVWERGKVSRTSGWEARESGKGEVAQGKSTVKGVARWSDMAERGGRTYDRGQATR